MMTYQQRLSLAMAFSLLLHVSVVWFYASPQIIRLLTSVFSRPAAARQHVTRPARPARALQRRIPQLSFVEVDSSQASLAKPQNARYFSDRSSLAANPAPLARSADIPKIEGRRMERLETSTVLRPGRPQPTPGSAPTPARQPSPPALTMRAETPPAPRDPAEGITAPRLLGKQPAQPAEGSPPEPQFQLRMEKPTFALRSEAPAGQPTQREIPTLASQSDGGVERKGPVALNVIGMPQGAYSKKMFAAIGWRWRLLLDQYYTDGPPGKVKLDFRLRPDGRVDNFAVAQNTASNILASYCQKAVVDSSPFDPWPDELKLLGGDHLDISVEFNVYTY
jgi:hypothetical protein